MEITLRIPVDGNLQRWDDLSESDKERIKTHMSTKLKKTMSQNEESEEHDAWDLR